MSAALYSNPGTTRSSIGFTACSKNKLLNLNPLTNSGIARPL